MQRLEVSGAVRPLYGSLGVKGFLRRRGLVQSWPALTFGAGIIFFKFLAHTVYKMLYNTRTKYIRIMKQTAF